MNFSMFVSHFFLRNICNLSCLPRPVIWSVETLKFFCNVIFSKDPNLNVQYSYKDNSCKAISKWNIIWTESGISLWYIIWRSRNEMTINNEYYVASVVCYTYKCSKLEETVQLCNSKKENIIDVVSPRICWVSQINLALNSN